MPFPNPDTQFRPGESGNPAGRPKGSVSLKARLKAALERTRDDKQVADELIDAIVDGALDATKFRGDKFLLKLLVEIEGSAKAPEEADADPADRYAEKIAADLETVYGDPDPSLSDGGEGGGLPA